MRIVIFGKSNDYSGGFQFLLGNCGKSSLKYTVMHYFILKGLGKVGILAYIAVLIAGGNS